MAYKKMPHDWKAHGLVRPGVSMPLRLLLELLTEDAGNSMFSSLRQQLVSEMGRRIDVVAAKAATMKPAVFPVGWEIDTTACFIGTNDGDLALATELLINKKCTVIKFVCFMLP